jgi:adenylylsulfate kinase
MGFQTVYKLARTGKIKSYTGVDDPYGGTENVVKALDGEYASPLEMAEQMLAYSDETGFLKGT